MQEIIDYEKKINEEMKSYINIFDKSLDFSNNFFIVSIYCMNIDKNNDRKNISEIFENFFITKNEKCEKILKLFDDFYISVKVKSIFVCENFLYIILLKNNNNNYPVRYTRLTSYFSYLITTLFYEFIPIIDIYEFTTKNQLEIFLQTIQDENKKKIIKKLIPEKDKLKYENFFDTLTQQELNKIIKKYDEDMLKKPQYFFYGFFVNKKSDVTIKYLGSIDQLENNFLL